MYFYGVRDIILQNYIIHTTLQHEISAAHLLLEAIQPTMLKIAQGQSDTHWKIMWDPKGNALQVYKHGALNTRHNNAITDFSDANTNEGKAL